MGARMRKRLERVGQQAADGWLEQVAESASAFEATGELPADPLTLDAVITGRELDLLIDASDEDDDAEMRAALAACDEPDENLGALAIDVLQALAEARTRRGLLPQDAPDARP